MKEEFTAVDMATAAAQGFRDGVASVEKTEIPNNQDASAAQSEPVEDRGWPDRDYWCKCCVCGEMFTGHKRQLVCRVCTEESAAQSAPAGEREAFELASVDDNFGSLRVLGAEAERHGLADGDYIDLGARKAWEYFQAGAAWQRTQSAVAPEFALRARVADLLHLLQFAKIETPTPGDAPQAERAMNDLEAMLAAPAQPAARPRRAPHEDHRGAGRRLPLATERRQAVGALEPAYRAVELGAHP